MWGKASYPNTRAKLGKDCWTNDKTVAPVFRVDRRCRWQLEDDEQGVYEWSRTLYTVRKRMARNLKALTFDKQEGGAL